VISLATWDMNLETIDSVARFDHNTECWHSSSKASWVCKIPEPSRFVSPRSVIVSKSRSRLELVCGPVS
jgi:hypothetical protein